jgi:isoleucyl-tRNA synthetase
MSKSSGNVVNPEKVMLEYGADTIRWYLCYASPVWTPIKFDEEGIKEVYSKFFNPLKNTYNFFSMYANTDGIDIKKCDVAYKDRDEIDKWLLSKYNNLLKAVTNSYDEFDLNKVARAVTSFVSDDLSNWYIRRNRSRFWGSEMNTSKKAVYITTYEVLVGLCKMIAPIIPYLTEEIYTSLVGEESVHLANYPTYDENLIDNALEEKMDLVRDLISIGRNIREVKNIKVRQPLSEILLDGRLEKTIDNLDALVLEELNVKKLTYISDLSKYMDFTVKPNFKEVGKIFGSAIKEYSEKLSKLSNDDIMALENNETISMEIAGKEYSVDKSMTDIRISSKDGFDVDMNNNIFVILNTELTPELIDEGIAREFVSKVQNMRKTNDFDIADRITITYSAPDNVVSAIKNFEEYVKNETLATKIEIGNAKEEVKLNEDTIKVSIKKVSKK